jgi:hypothetical protein
MTMETQRLIQLEPKNNLLHASLTLHHDGRTLPIDDLIVDTGAVRSLISVDLVEELGFAT